MYVTPTPNRATLRIRGFLFTVLAMTLVILVLFLAQPSVIVTLIVRIASGVMLLGLAIWGLFIPKYRDLAIGALGVWILAALMVAFVFGRVLITGSLMD